MVDRCARNVFVANVFLPFIIVLHMNYIIRAFSLSQMNDVELARVLSWRENALFKELEKKLCLLVKKLPV